jgi:hypothetical protein
MKRRAFLLGTASAALILCGPALAAPIQATLYRDPGCPCCGAYANYLRSNGFVVEVVPTLEFKEVGRKAGVPQALEGCHTVFIGDYVVSGHVPIEFVRKMLDERPPITGITLAGMPAGSPGMDGDKTETFTIYAFTKDRKAPSVYATQ